MADRKNVLVFLTDGHRADCLGCYENPILKTPNVDRMAREGLRFSRSYATHTVCMPTSASIFTGRYPHVHGVWSNGIPLPRDEVTLPEVLVENGYRTCSAGKIHFEPQGGHSYPPVLEPGERYYGFQEVHLNENRQGSDYLRFVETQFPELAETAAKRGRLPEEAHELTWITDRAIDFVERQAREGAPFFAVCSFHELSPMCHPPIGFDDLYAPEDMPPPKVREGELVKKPPYHKACYEGQVALGRFPDEARLRQLLASYYNQTAFLDKQFGRLVDALKRLGIWEDTIVLFTSDHGLMLNDHYQWRHGPFLYEQVIRVPMVWHIPGIPGDGRALDGMVESVDIMPTILDLVGVETPPGVQGQSVRPMLCGEPGAAWRESILAQDREAPELWSRGIDPAGFRIKAVRTEDWKLIHFPGCPYGELYDLKNDPDEFDNLWADAGYRRKRREMEHLLLERLLATEDPLPVREYPW